MRIMPKSPALKPSDLKQACEGSNKRAFLYLPPYSPQLNVIEEAFSCVAQAPARAARQEPGAKNTVRKHQHARHADVVATKQKLNRANPLTLASHPQPSSKAFDRLCLSVEWVMGVLSGRVCFLKIFLWAV